LHLEQRGVEHGEAVDGHGVGGPPAGRRAGWRRSRWSPPQGTATGGLPSPAPMARLLCSLLVCSLLLGVSAATAAVPQAPFGGPVDDHPDGPPVPDGGYVQTPPSTPLGGTPVWPGVAWDVRSTTVGAGLNVNVHVLHLAADDPGVDVTPVLAGGTVRGT